MSLAKIFFYMFILVKPFYLLESGSFQLGDMFLMLSALAVFVDRLRPDNRKDFWRLIDKEDWLFIFFTIVTLLINGCYFVFYRDIRLLLSSAYFIYNFVGIILFRCFARDERFLSRIELCFRADVYLQLLMLVTGVGKYRFEHRWCGTFNDPNQMAFFLMMCLFFIFIINEMRGRHSCLELLDWSIGILLFVLSKSVGILFGVIVFGTAYAVWRCCKWVMSGKKVHDNKKKIGIFWGIVAGVLALIGFTVWTEWKTGDEFNIFVRIILKLEALFHGGLTEVLTERGIDRMWRVPLPVLYGAGDGAFGRYAGMGCENVEMHSTLLGLLYCYGIIPFGMICCWVYRNIRRLPLVAYTVYFALLCESMFLVNYRQPFFWMIFVLGNIWSKKLSTVVNKV